jgi:hypothetical protein
VFSTSVGTPYAPGPGFRFAGGPGPAGVPYSPGEIRTPAMESAEANDWSREELAAYAAAYGWTQLPAMSGWGRPGEDVEMREVYREMMRDESVKAAVLQKILGVSSLGLSFVLPKGWEGNPQAARINEFVGYNFEEHLHSGWPQTAWSLLSGMLQEGHVLGEPVMEKAPIRGGPWDGKRPLAKIKSKDPKTYDLILDPFLNLHAVRSRMNLHVVRPAERYLVLSHLPVYENPLGTSDLRSAYRAFVCKDAALKLRQLFLDKYAGPFLYATVTDNAFKAELAKDLKKARAAGYIVLPPGTTLQVLSLATASDAAFKSAIDDYDRAILIGILGSYLHVLEGQTQDGRGDTKVHRGVAELFQWFLAETLANAITRQVVPKIVHENFWLPCYPRAVLEAVDPNQIKSELMIGTMLRNAGVATSLSMWYEKSRWARPASKEDTLEGKPFNAPGGGPFGSGGGGEAFSDDEPDEPPPGPAPADALVAGPDGGRAGELLSKVIADGSRRLADAAAPAVRRLMDHPLRGRYQARLFSDEELHRVAGVIAESMAHGDLLGRAAVRDRWRQEESGEHAHCDQPAGLRAFADAVEPAGGIREALAYFRGLEPSLSAEPERFGPPLLRRAFTLAQDADRVVLKRVQDSIAKAVEGGLPVDEVARSVDEILDDAGIGPRRRGYSELVVRTNMADAYTAGIEAERNDPEVRDAFPAWYYAAVIDGRERPTHGARHGMLFPREVAFNDVRGTEARDVCQCRCVPVVVTRRELARLRAGGREFSDPRMVVHSEHAHAGWDETEHPRDKGRFAPKAGGVASTIPPGQFPAAIDLEDMAGELGFRNAGQWLDAATGFGRAAAEPGGDRLVHRAEEYGQKNYTISSKLRSGRPLTPDEHEQVKAVDELARRGGLPVAMELHRVVGEGFPDLKPGDVYRDPAPASTSYDPEVTKNIAVRGRRRDLVIEAPAGSPALYTPAGERGEIVLPSGSALKVVSAEGGTIRARLEPPAGSVPEKGPAPSPGLEDFRLSPKRKRQLRERINTYVRVQIGLGKDGDAAEKEITARIADELRSGVTRHAEGGQRRLFAHAGWDASKHRRGQPGNKGQFVGPGGSAGGGVGSGGGSPGRGPGAGMVSVREAIDRHDGDIGEASAELRSKISDYMRAGGKVSLWYDGKEVPVAKVEGGAVYDAKGQRWGMMPLAMGIKGTKTGIEFKAPEEHPAVAKAKDFAEAKAAEHADAVARVLGVKSQAARAKLHQAILAAARHSIANGSGSVTIRGPNGRTVRVTVRYKGKPHSEGGEDFELEIEEVKGGAHADRPFAHAGYDPGKHPRGQPGNRGEFGPGGGGISGAVSAVTERAKANVRAAVGHLPESVRGPLGNAYHAVHASLMAVNRSARTLARRVAEERGGSPEHVERLSRVLAAADLIVPGAVGLAVASTGAVAAGKLASYVPVGSMSYVLYSAARNPAAVLRAAGRAIQRDFPETAKGAWRFALGAARHPLTPAATVHAASPAGVGLIDDYLRHFAPQGEFAEAALLAALDETRDVAAAVRMASQVASQRSYAGTDPSKHPHKPKGKGGGQFAKKGAVAGGIGGVPDEDRPSRPENRRPGAGPKVYPWRPPPPKLARAAGTGRAERPRGDESQTKLGDQSEALAKELGFRNIIPEGRRAHRPGEVAEKGSTIDVEFDHSGRAYEIKMCRVESTEYRLKAKASEKEAKLKFAELNKLEPYTMVAVRDGPRGEVHFYGSREQGLIGAEVSEKYFDYLGTVRIA